MSKKPSIPKGTRDFNPEEVSRRNYIFNIIKETFSLYGFQPIETPSFENSDTLMGKYGEEGDRLIFKILESGEYFEKAKEKIYTIDHKSVMYIDSLFTKFFLDIRNYFIEESKSGISSKVFLRQYFTELEISHVFDSLRESEYLFNYKELITDFIKMNSEIIVSKILDDEYFFTNKEVFDNFLLKDKVEIQKQLIEFIKLNELDNISSNKLTSLISEKALRYDLTVPFARYVVQHQNEITFPFKRYQMQPVWRADRPQKGRFREFYQCDADVVGSKSLWQEVEFVQLYDAVFSKLGLEGVTIKINNRKILSGIAEVIGAEDKLIDFTVALDKLDKIGEEGVKKEMREKGISEDALQKLQPLFSFKGSNEDKLNSLKEMLQASQLGMKGVGELAFIVEYIKTLGLQTASIEIDVTLARGLNYYTGAILEVSAPEKVSMGSIGGGGRYDDLTGIFGLKDMSGMGISFGLDRIYLVLEELNLFPETVSENSKALFLNFGEKEALYAMQAITKLRNAGVKAELYPDATKMGKQMGYADKRDIPYTVLTGEKEMEAQSYTLKNMKTGEQSGLTFSELEAYLLKK